MWDYVPSELFSPVPLSVQNSPKTMLFHFKIQDSPGFVQSSEVPILMLLVIELKSACQNLVHTDNPSSSVDARGGRGVAVGGLSNGQLGDDWTTPGPPPSSRWRDPTTRASKQSQTHPLKNYTPLSHVSL